MLEVFERLHGNFNKKKTSKIYFLIFFCLSNLLSDPNIQEYLQNVIVQNNEGFQVKEYFSPSPKSMSFKSSSADDPIWDSNMNEDLFMTTDYNSVNNANLLRDIESLIHNMEKKQSTSKDNDSMMLQNIDSILSNIKLNESRPHSPQSNQSAEPIRMKSPIMLPSRNDDKIKNGFQDVIDNIRNFVTNNIQDIVPDLVSQVEKELTTDLHDEEVREITLENLDEILRNQHEVEVVGSNHSELTSAMPPIELNLEDFLRSRHDVEFNERNISPMMIRPESIYSDSYTSVDDTAMNDFLRKREEEEYEERNSDFPNANMIVKTASHDSITVSSQGQENYGVNLIAEENTIGSDSNVGETTSANNNEIEINEAPAEVETEVTPELVVVENNQQLEPLKYKSSYNLRILKRSSKRTKSEKDFKRRNSLIFENVLLGKKTPLEPAKVRPKSLALNIDSVVTSQVDIAEGSSSPSPQSSPSTSANSTEGSNINHHTSLISENIERKSEENLNEINASGSEGSVESRVNGEDAESKINGNGETDVQDESLLLLEGLEVEQMNEVIETTVQTVVEIIINDESDATQNVIDSGVNISSPDSTHVVNAQSFENMLPSSYRASSSNDVSTANESDPSKAPQNLSELVEDTQRLIKQMKDEINAIYVSDEEFTSSEETEYSDEWIEGFEDEYTDEEVEEQSEYEDWSGDEVYVESETAPEDIFIEVPFLEDIAQHDAQANFDASVPADAIEDNSELLDTLIIGDVPNETNEMENEQTESVVHGKLELTPMSSNQLKVDANTETGNESGAASSSVTTLNDNDINLNNSTSSLIVQEANDETVVQESTLLSSNATFINNEITAEPTNSIKEVVNEAINDVISTISFDESESIGNDNNHPQIDVALASSQPNIDNEENPDSTNIDSAMNNSENISAEAMSKVSDSNNDLIASGNMLLNDDGNIEAITVASTEEASNAEYLAESEVNLSVIEKSDQSQSNTVNDDDDVVQDVQSVESPKPLITTEVDIIEAVTGESNQSSDNVPTTSKIQAEDNPKTKGAVAKTKIPAKVKNVKRTNSITKESDKTSQEDSKSKSSSPEKIKEPVKTKQDAESTANTQDKSPKQVQAGRKNSFDNNLRKKSVPFGLLATSNVKNLQKEFLNKSNVPPPAKTTPTKLKPSKLVSPKASLPTFANKLTKLITPPSSAKSSPEKSSPTVNTKETLQRDYSKDVVPEKKYMEHCFSDEYPTTSEDEEEDEREQAKAPKSFFNKRKPTRDSDDETSDVRETFLVSFFFLRSFT